MKIAVIGMGNVGIAVGDNFMKNGHEVKYGVRSPDSDKTKAGLSERPQGATAEAVKDAVSWSDVIVLATPSLHDDAAIQEMAKSLGNGVDGKLIADATNPVTAYPEFNVRWEEGTSCAEVLQEALPNAKVAKIFNTIGSQHMINPQETPMGSKALTMLVACDAPAKAEAMELTAASNFDPVYAGPLRYSRNLEAIAELWIHMAVLKTAGENNSNFHLQFVSDEKPL